MSGAAETDALLGEAIASIEELEALLAMLIIAGGLDEEQRYQRSASISTQLREIANLLNDLPKLQHDFGRIKQALRAMLSSDPEKTPRGGIGLHKIPVGALPSTPEDTHFSPVEEQTRKFRADTRPGIGSKSRPPPLPPKLPKPK